MRSALLYRLVSVMVHQPRLLRWLGTALRRWPWLSAQTLTLAGHAAVASAFRRPCNFSNASHAANLVAGEFAIGMDMGPRHGAERAFLERVLPSPAEFGRASAHASAELVQRLNARRASGATEFDLIDEYMVTVVWSGLKPVFGAAAPGLEGADEAERLRFFVGLRYLGAQLIGGGFAPKSVYMHAVSQGAALNRRVDAQLGPLQAAWSAQGPPSVAAVRRNAVGLLWVAHPATVQAGALLMQELLARPDEYLALQRRAQQLGEQAWHDAAFRTLLRAHVLELLRFRPPFPLLVRNVPRDAELELAPGRRVKAAAGRSLRLLAVAAMFDPLVFEDAGAYRPGRDQSAVNAMTFGFGERACIAREHVPEVLVSALAGLLRLPRLRYADGWLRRIGYDGPIIDRMRLALQ